MDPHIMDPHVMDPHIMDPYVLDPHILDLACWAARVDTMMGDRPTRSLGAPLFSAY